MGAKEVLRQTKRQSRAKNGQWWLRILLLLITLYSSLPYWGSLNGLSTISAQPEPCSREYTQEHPLVYEDAWDLWPYSFLNETGTPVGYNIDLIQLIFKELKIPYRIKLKPTQDALNDLKEGHADLMCGMDAHYHNDYAQYGKSVIQIFTHSVVHHKDEPVLIKTIDDLASQRVIVHDGAFSHHLMIKKGWGKNAIPYNDMQEAIQHSHNEKGSQIVWNTLSLKWLLHKFNYNDLELTPVNIPHGEYKFMSNDTVLLERMDSVYTKLSSTGRLQPIQNKWFYPELKETGIPSWMWYVVAALILLFISFIAYYISYRLYERRMTKKLLRTNNRLSLILNTSKVHIWLINIVKQTVTGINSDGKKSTIPLSPYFFDNYMIPEDYERLCTLLNKIASQAESPSDTKKYMLDVHVTKKKIQDLRTISLNFSVMEHDRNGFPTVIIGATTDITDARHRQQQQKDMMLRYQHIFNSALIDNVSFDEHGILDDMSEKTLKNISGGIQRVINAHVSVQSILGAPDLSLNDLDYTYLTQIFKQPDDPRPLNRALKLDELYYELQLVPVRDEQGQLLGIYGNGRNVTEIAKSYSNLQKNIVQLQEATNELQDYIRNIDYIMQNGGMRIIEYTPNTHTLHIYSEIQHVQHRLTQTRLLSLTSDESKKTALHILNSMDNLTLQPVKADIKTTLRIKGNSQLCLYFSFVPIIDDNGNVTSYFGMCRDISDIKATEEKLAKETVKAQEIEKVKNVFLHNMCYEIRTPLNSVVGFSELFEKEHNAEDEVFFIEEIKRNSRILLNLINNILLISRIDAGMIEFKTVPYDFATFFEDHCQSAWEDYRKVGVNYIIDQPYKRLVLDIDLNIGIAIDHIVTNAAQHTTSGYVRASFDYNGEELTITVQDTGSGIPEDLLKTIFERFVTTDNSSSGLGLPICQEILKLMGGRIRIKSEQGKGTIVWMIIPCTCREIQRK